jgi:hypothetical protein
MKLKMEALRFFTIWVITLMFSDRASQYKLVLITNLMHNSFIL